jgi:pimeloyl-ACP methyl ester carboxylesterase
VITFDNRGVGRTDKPPGPYSAQILAEDTAGLLQALQVPHAAILGHSMGGFIAQALALSYPEMVSKLILSATNFGGPHHIPATPEAMQVLLDTRGDPIERLRRGILISCAPGFAERQPEMILEWLVYREQNLVDPLAYQAQLAVGLGLYSEESSFKDRLKNIRVPTLILFGEHDKVVPPGNAGLLAAEIPYSQVRILPGGGHFFPIEIPELAVAAILEFLKKNASPEEVKQRK